MKFKKCCILSGLNCTRRFAFTHTKFNVLSKKRSSDYLLSLILLVDSEAEGITILRNLGNY
jgi:hypothetical protein